MMVTVTRVHTLYCVNIVDVTLDMGQRARNEKVLNSLEGKVEELRKMLVESFDDHSDFCLYTIKYHVLHQMVQNIGRF